MGELIHARQHYVAGLKHKPDYLAALLQLANLTRADNQVEQALAYY